MSDRVTDSRTPTPAGLSRRTLLGGAASVVLGGGAVLAAATPAHAAESQNGWPAGTSSQVPLTALTVGAATFPAGVRSGEVATILGYVARRFDAEVERLVAGWCWGHAYRPIRGGSTLSNHSSGTALDLNAPRHPLGSSGTFSAAQVRSIRSILDACGGVVRWGGDYSVRKDEMHVEMNVRPGDPRIAALVAKIGGTTPPPAPPAPPAATWSTVRRGSDGFRVVAIQHLLRHRAHSVTVDGAFGPATERAVIAFQGTQRLAADGVVGPKTWTSLAVELRRGASGEAVRGAQKSLTARGYPTTADGAFGPATDASARRFQTARKLEADGIIGPRTWSALTA